MSEIRWGVISTGRIAQQFARDMKFVERSRIVAATSRTRANAEAYAQEFGIETVHPSVDALLADDNVDAVYVATPHTVHIENTLSAIEAGKPVLCEKPLTVSAEEAERVAAAARGASVYVMEAMWTWFLPAIRTAVDWIEAGRIGRLVQIKADFGYPMRPYSPDMRVYDARLGGGVMLDMGIYPVALVWLLMRRQPNDVHAVYRHAPNGVEDDVSAVLDYGDVVATIGTSFRCKLQNWAYIVGEDGYIAIPDFLSADECRLYETDTLVESFEDGRESIGLNFETQAVVDDLLAGQKVSSLVTLDDSIGFQRTMERIRDSASD